MPSGHYKSISELAAFIDEELKEGRSMREYFYYHALRKWGLGEKVVNKIIDNGIAVGAFKVDAKGLVERSK